MENIIYEAKKQAVRLLADELISFVYNKQKVYFVKAIKQFYGLGLKEAKEIMDIFYAKNVSLINAEILALDDIFEYFMNLNIMPYELRAFEQLEKENIALKNEIYTLRAALENIIMVIEFTDLPSKNNLFSKTIQNAKKLIEICNNIH